MKKKNIAIFFGIILSAANCSVLTEDEPEFGDSSELTKSIPLDATVAQHLIGNYTAVSSNPLFRGRITIIAANSRISIFSYESETYAVLNAGCRDNAVIFEGKTHDPVSQTVGLIRLRIAPNQGANEICKNPPDPPAVAHVRYTGQYGADRNNMIESLTLQYAGPLRSTANTYIIAHHGCRTVDNCGASENSLEGIKYAGYLGANAVEVDVLLSKDGVPVMFHDEDFNSRLTTGIFCLGDVTNYTVLMMKVFCRLKYGETIPTLRETLTALLTDDTIKMIWLDPKNTTAMGAIVALANEFKIKAQQVGKSLEILIGLPDEDYANAWLAAPGHESTKCLVEYSLPATQVLGCRAYGPRFTMGPQPADAGTLHASGQLMFYWTLNDKSFFDTYLGYGGADGFITDRPFLLYTHFQK